MDTRPIIVAIEGPDGCGKTRHVGRAVEHLRAQGIEARAFHHAKPGEGNAVLDAIGYTEQRSALVDSLPRGDVVIADRWFWSTLAYRNGLLRDVNTPASAVMGTGQLRDIAEEEADAMGWGRVATRFDDVLPVVVVNYVAPHVAVRMALIVLDAPDTVLDARLSGRGEALLARRHGGRAVYRRATCVDTSGDTADALVPRLVRWAVDGLRMGAL